MKYRREIDGLRAVAVLPIILFHAGFKAFEGGFVGVDIFFVISGYLITTIILSDMSNNSFSVVTFYERRARRILPPLFFIMLCCLPFAWLWLSPIHLKNFSQSLTAVSTFSSNILFCQESGYFETTTELKPLLHTWYLAVQEQYYIVFILFMTIVLKISKQLILASIAGAAAASLILAQWGAYNCPVANFYLLPSRAWELAIGALIAFFFLYKKHLSACITAHKATNELMGLLGLSLIVYAIFTFSNTTPNPSFYTLIPTLGTALIIIFAKPETISGRILSTKALVGIGLISYSAYLWHQPLFAFAKHRNITEPSTTLLLLLSALSIILAYCTWRYIEKPFRDRKAIKQKTVFSFAVIGLIFFAAIGLTGPMTNGFENRTTASGARFADISKKIAINHGLCPQDDKPFKLSSNCMTSDEPDILLWGDSYAMQLAQGLVASNPDIKMIQLTKSFCGPFFDTAPVSKLYPVRWAKGCLAFNSAVRDWLKENTSVKYAVLSSPFSNYFGEGRLLIDGKLYDADRALATKRFLATLDELESMGVTPIVFSPLPHYGNNIGECLVKAAYLGVDLSVCDFDRENASEKSKNEYDFLRTIAKEYTVVFLDEGTCDSGVCDTAVDNIFLYRDSTHLSQEGSAYLGKKMHFYDLIVGKNAVAEDTR